MYSKRLLQGIVILAASLLFAACSGESTGPAASASASEGLSQQRYEWKMVTTWPKNFPGLGTAAQRFADRVETMSSGRMRIRVYGAGEMVPAMEVFDAVSAGTAEIGHGAAYYWKGKVPEGQFFTALPFGLNAREMDAWIRNGGGLALWREAYEPFNLIPYSGGNTGVQMGGWFNKEINSVADFRGLKMRIPGLAADVLSELGGLPVNLAGGELFTSLQTGVIDATEFVGPFNDLAFGLHQVADYYYYPGWHEPGSVMEYLFNKQRFEALPADLQAILEAALTATALEMTDEFTARNSASLQELVEDHGVELREFPPDLLIELNRVSQQVIDELATLSPLAERIHASYRQFEAQVRRYHSIAEQAYDEARQL